MRLNDADGPAEAVLAELGTAKGEVSAPTRVFISYAHDDSVHEERVRDFWLFLRAHGIDARLDVSAGEQRLDWADWMTRQIRDAERVLVIASPEYKRRAEGDALASEGRGVQWEARLIRDVFYRDQPAGVQRVLPVVLPGGSAADIPLWLTPASVTHYMISEFTVAGAEKLLRVLTRQPWETEPPVGVAPVLPSRPIGPPGRVLTVDDRRRLKQELCRVYPTRETFDALFAEWSPPGAETVDVLTIEQAWAIVVQRCADLPSQEGFAPLIKLVYAMYPYNTIFQEFAKFPIPTAATTMPGRSNRPRVLSVATEWMSVQSALSVFNRRLCTALSQRGADVTCLVLRASEREMAQAAAAGVHLLVAQPVLGGLEREALFRRPDLPTGMAPDVVIGHGRLTGGAAQMQYRDHFPNALGVHVIHMADEQADTDVALALRADLIAAVGPVLSGRFEMELSAYGASARVMRLDPGFTIGDESARIPPPGNPIRVLLLGHIDDAGLTGLKTAAAAVAHAGRFLPPGRHLELLVRGSAPSHKAAIDEEIKQWSGRPELRIVPREYTAEYHRLEADLRSSSLLLVPPLGGDFGLDGVEAIVAGTPLLVSQSSGLGSYLREVLPPEQAARAVVDDWGDPVAAWGQEVLRVVKDREAAFREADRLRRDLAARRPWSAVADDLLMALSVRQ